jgi:8-oxo-dGTP pyrophosphatase MutT (NUDIX family)
MKEKIYRAGLIPFFINENNNIEMKFMVPSDQKFGGGDPQFAKGRIEKNENHEEAAIREAKEELGLREDNVEWIYYLGQFLGRTHIHICEVKTRDKFDEPHYETESTHWLTLEEFENSGRELHRPVIREAYMIFEQMKQEEEEGGEEFEEIEIN